MSSHPLEVVADAPLAVGLHRQRPAVLLHPQVRLGSAHALQSGMQATCPISCCAPSNFPAPRHALSMAWCTHSWQGCSCSPPDRTNQHALLLLVARRRQQPNHLQPLHWPAASAVPARPPSRAHPAAVRKPKGCVWACGAASMLWRLTMRIRRRPTWSSIEDR